MSPTRRPFRPIGPSLVALLALCSACASNDWGSDRGKYSIKDRRDLLREVSPLMTIDRTGAVTFCIQMAGAREELRPGLERAARRAVDGWNSLLNDPPPPDQGALVFPEWRRRSVEVVFACGGSPVWTIIADASVDRSYALAHQRRIVLDRDVAGGDQDPYLVIAHEYGHLIGLGDTYYEPEIGFDFDGQPDSMMQSMTGFTDDDRAGVWNLWRWLVNGGDPCGPGYARQGSRDGPNAATYCIPETDAAASRGEGDASCTYRCTDYGYAPSQCALDRSGLSWQCDPEGCLHQVEACDDAGEAATCSSPCSEMAMRPGDCAETGAGRAWSCASDGCLRLVDSCTDGIAGSSAGADGSSLDDGSGSSPGDDGSSPDDGSGSRPDDGSGGWGSACELTCDDSGLSPGECAEDWSGRSFECGTDGCAYEVSYCWTGDSCTVYCGDYGLGAGDCGIDATGLLWLCADDGCMYVVPSC